MIVLHPKIENNTAWNKENRSVYKAWNAWNVRAFITFSFGSEIWYNFDRNSGYNSDEEPLFQNYFTTLIQDSLMILYGLFHL
jgi:hypothetical protein